MKRIRKRLGLKERISSLLSKTPGINYDHLITRVELNLSEKTVDPVTRRGDLFL